MSAWNHFLTRKSIKEYLIFNRKLRRLYNGWYRYRNKTEKSALFKYLSNKKTLVAIGLAHVYFLEHVRQLLSLLNQDQKLDLFLIGPPVLPARVWKTEFYKFLGERYSIAYNKNVFAHPWLKLAKPRLFLELCISTYGTEVKCPRVIYAHGLAGLNFSKDYRHIKFLSNYNAIFLTGPLQKKAILAAQKLYGGQTLPPMYEIGYLKVDRLLELASSFNKEKFLGTLGLPTSRPTILYAPTWGNFSSAKLWIDKIARVCLEMEVNLLLRLHPIMVTSTSTWETGGVNWPEKLVKLSADFSNLLVVKNHDLDEIMLAADVMVTDVSSLGLEFLSMEKPVIFLPAPNFFKIYGEERPEKWCRPDYEIKTAAELKRKLEQAIDGKGHKFSSKEIVYNRGKAAQAMIEAIRQMSLK